MKTDLPEPDLDGAIRELQESRRRLISIAKRIIESVKPRREMRDGLNGTRSVADLCREIIRDKGRLVAVPG